MVSKKHVIHSCVLLLTLTATPYVLFYYWRHVIHLELTWLSGFIMALNYAIILMKIFHVVQGVLSLLLFECFPSNHSKIKVDPASLPLISLRVVTRGEYPQLIKKNVDHNLTICEQVGLKKILVEIVTEKRMPDIAQSEQIRQIVVPDKYRTKNGTLFKGRNLQYCLEEGTSCLADHDWIVHLDEDSLLTKSAAVGIANFIHDSRHYFGFGGTTFDSPTSIAVQCLMGMRVFYYYGMMRFRLKRFQQCLTFMPGSFVVVRNREEKIVNFDGGLRSSLLEFFYLCRTAESKGYSFGSVEGNFVEMGPLTFTQAIQQVTRLQFGFRLMFSHPNLERVKWTAVFVIQSSMYFLYFIFTVFNLFVTVSYLTQPLMIFQGLIAGCDIYSFTFLHLKSTPVPILKIALMFVPSIFFAAFISPFGLAIGIFLSLFHRDVKFLTTKKEI